MPRKTKTTQKLTETFYDTSGFKPSAYIILKT